MSLQLEVRRSRSSSLRAGAVRANRALAAALAFVGLSSVAASARELSVAEVLAALGKEHALGSAKAPVVMVEFSDFQCSFCKKFWAEALPRLKEAYIEKGKVRFVYRHFAVLGKLSQQAASAAECAGEQGRFWDYHDRLFANQGAFTDGRLKSYAGELKLNAVAFGKCLDGARYEDRVKRETAAALSLGVRGTPAFFVNGRLLVGAQPFEAFRRVIEEELRRSAGRKR
jgi:protein-disulfide isomerase